MQMLLQWQLLDAIQLIKDNHLYDTLQDTYPDTRLLAIQKWRARIIGPLTFDFPSTSFHLARQNYQVASLAD
jgi:hypothetical protein